MYNAVGVDELSKIKFNRPKSQMVAYKDSLQRYNLFFRIGVSY